MAQLFRRTLLVHDPVVGDPAVRVQEVLVLKLAGLVGCQVVVLPEFLAFVFSLVIRFGILRHRVERDSNLAHVT